MCVHVCMWWNKIHKIVASIVNTLPVHWYCAIQIDARNTDHFSDINPPTHTHTLALQNFADKSKAITGGFMVSIDFRCFGIVKIRFSLYFERATDAQHFLHFISFHFQNMVASIEMYTLTHIYAFTTDGNGNVGEIWRNKRQRETGAPNRKGVEVMLELICFINRC